MLDTLSASNPSVTWDVNGGEFQMTFNVNGTGNIGKTNFNWSIGLSGNPDFPVSFIAQADHPIIQQAVQVWCGIVGANSGAGYMTNGWPPGQAGTLAGMNMKLA